MRRLTLVWVGGLALLGASAGAARPQQGGEPTVEESLKGVYRELFGLAVDAERKPEWQREWDKVKTMDLRLRRVNVVLYGKDSRLYKKGSRAEVVRQFREVLYGKGGAGTPKP